MYTLKSIARRGTMLGAAVAVFAAAIAPAAPAFADALNPLTERSLMLSSSAPGYVDTDGSGNSAGTPNAIGENYAPAGSGPNGKKTGETFTFKTSSTSANPIKAFSLQYCTKAAGLCLAPGNNQGDARSGATTARETNAAAWPNQRSDLDIGSFTYGTGAGQFSINVGANTPSTASDWTMTSVTKEDTTASGAMTGKNNYITITSPTGQTIPSGTVVQIIFRASETNYITNPGAGSFFVKINTFDSDTAGDIVAGGTHNIDGGVTVANVMTDSIHITTKVLETMSFSVGTRNRDTAVLNCAGYPSQATIAAGCEGNASAGIQHGKCDPITQVNNNRLSLGDPDAEYSLDTRKAYDVYSYWRLSSNSSGGASVYYSGNTLQNTVGDQIDDMPNEAASQPGTNQFGLGFTSATETNASDYTGAVSDSAPFKTLSTQSGSQYTAGQTASDAYDEAGLPNTIDDGNAGAGTAKFKFKKSSLTVPELIAQENTDVVSCATAKMRYVGNIGADTPAGVYTTKINYLAAPQY